MTKSTAKSEAVQVCIRCRPFNKKEIAENYKKCVDFHKDRGEIHLEHETNKNKNKIFTYDKIFPMNTSQIQLYEEAASGIVDSVLEGYNGTIFAYGQTGTGKTYTMEGPDDVSNPNDIGINPRAFKHIFDHIDTSKDIEYLVRVSFIQIYLDKVSDLLAKDPEKTLAVKK